MIDSDRVYNYFSRYWNGSEQRLYGLYAHLVQKPRYAQYITDINQAYQQFQAEMDISSFERVFSPTHRE